MAAAEAEGTGLHATAERIWMIISPRNACCVYGIMPEDGLTGKTSPQQPLSKRFGRLKVVSTPKTGAWSQATTQAWRVSSAQQSSIRPTMGSIALRTRCRNGGSRSGLAYKDASNRCRSSCQLRAIGSNCHPLVSGYRLISQSILSIRFWGPITHTPLLSVGHLFYLETIDVQPACALCWLIWRVERSEGRHRVRATSSGSTCPKR